MELATHELGAFQGGFGYSFDLIPKFIINCQLLPIFGCLARVARIDSILELTLVAKQGPKKSIVKELGYK